MYSMLNIEMLEPRRLLSGYTLANLGFFADGGQAAENPIQDSAGNLYGLTQAGGTNSTGSVYEIAAGSKKITTLASFPATTTGSVYPTSLVIDSAGDLFGTTDRGGDSGTGDVFEIVKGSGIITTLASFDLDNGTAANVTGSYPEGNIIRDAAGNLFGTAVDGGGTVANPGGGTYWELKQGASTITPLVVFPTLNSTAISGVFYPARPNFFAQDSAGDTFGVTEGDQSLGYYGYVWKIAANSSTVDTLSTFQNTNGSDPLGSVAVDASGNVFGTTLYGGPTVINDTTNAGVVWEVRAGSGTITDLASFSASVGYSADGVTLDSKGDLFGTANYGGIATPADGTVWELPVGASTITTLTSFGATGGGQIPAGGVLIDSSGNLFGNSYQAGGPKGTGNGNVFELVAPGNTLPAGIAALSPVVTKTTLPLQIVAGSAAHGSATVSITNHGSSAESGSVLVSVYASTDGVIDNSSTLLGSTTTSLHTKVGITGKVTVTIKSIPISLSGAYTLLAKTADASGVTTPAATGPVVDISAAHITFIDTLIKTTLASNTLSGQKSKAAAQIKITNNGNIVSNGTTTIALYASPNGTVANGTLIRTYSATIALKPEASKTVTVPLLAIPVIANGNYFIVAQISDPLSDVTAVSANAVSFAAAYVSLLPTIVSTTLPASSVSGAKSAAAIFLSIINNGNVAPTSASTISVYASPTGTVTAGTLLIGTPFKTALKPAKSTKIKISFSDFSLLSPGSYFLVVQITGSSTTTTMSTGRYLVVD